MKKYLLKQAKKSMSLFLAVLMLLSCWVWVAPEKAEAANIDLKTGYTVVVNWTISKEAIAGGEISYKTVSNSGWGTESSETLTLNSMSDKLSVGDYSHTFTTTDFPTVIKVTTTAACNTSPRTEVSLITINGKTVYQNSTEGWNGGNSCEYYPTYTDGGDFGTTGSISSDKGTFSWPRPHIAGFVDNDATANEINLTINQVGGSTVNGSTNFNFASYKLYDQYGVEATAYLKNNKKYCTLKSESTHIATLANSDTAVEDIPNTVMWVGDDGKSVYVTPDIQIRNPQGTDGKAEYFLVKKYVYDDALGAEVTSKVSAKINLSYPKYDVVFNTGITDAKITADAVTPYTGTYTASNYNGGTIVPPSKTEKAGYTFHGYWTKAQPTSGNASYNALEADFAKPCSTEDYNAYKATGTINGDIVTDTDGNKWYDAGKEMVPSDIKTIDVENYDSFVKTWYGWWIADDIKLKFYDVDGSFLGEKAVKSGQTQGAITWPNSKYLDNGYTTGAFKFKVDGNTWVNTDGTEINKNSYTFIQDLILTPKLTRESFTDEYAVTFINPNNGSSVAAGSNGTYAYRADIKSNADTALGNIADTPADVDGALDYSYELLGWSSVEPTTGKNYHVLLEDADFDVNGTSIGLNSDWVVRDEATYYAVYRRHTKTYVVDFKYKDATGADATRQLKVKYGATLTPPTEYVPYTYVTKGFGYTFNKWAYSTDNGDATLDYAATIPFTSEYISIEGAALEGSADLDPIEINATYGAPVATPYTVTFNYVNDEGEEVSKSEEVKNEQFILQDTVNSLTPAEKWDHEDNLYTYADKWEIIDGAATVGIGGTEKKIGDIIDTDDLTGLTPTSNLTFKAVYANPVPFYTVTYNHGAKTETFRVLKDSNVPAWTIKAINDNGTPDDKTDDFVEEKIYAPEDYEGDGGTYVFQGWYDEKQTDETFKTTNGNKVTAADKVTGNLTLYSQFKFVPDTFEIKFMSYDGKVQLSAGEFEKGQNIEAITAVANKAAQGRPADDTYTYLFLGWDKPVPTFCEGQDVTFIAQYKPVYKYYDVKWYNSRLVDGKWAADKTVTEGVETNLLATTHHTYNSKLYTPAVDNLVCLETAPDGKNYVFAGWYYNDAEGNAVKYERGMLVTAEMEFYATYTLTAKAYTVTAVVKGEDKKYVVAENAVADIPDPQAGYVDEDSHDAFVGWYADAEFETEFDLTAPINADTKIYAKFEESAHTYPEANNEIKTYPTYYEEGIWSEWCSCDAELTKRDKADKIPMLTDTKIPTGTIYLGANSWSSEGEAANVTDNDPISIFVNANTDVIVTANDTGDVDALYNPSGIGKGIKVIRGFVFPADTVLTADNYGAAQQLAIDIYTDDTEALTNNANFAVKLGDFIVADLDADGKVQYDDEGEIKYKPLESGESYIIYYYVVDKADNQLNRKVRTAKFTYDTTAPVFAVEGASNGATVPTYCGEATVTGIEKGVILTVNGTAVNVTYAEGAETGTYKIAYTEGMDNVIITATDKAGNTYSKKIKVADHSWLVEDVESTCTEDGYKKEVCIICKEEKTNETYESVGHVMGQPEITPADCVNNGYVVTKCEICGYEVKVEFEEDGITPLFPALGHEYEKDENGEVVYETITASTCKTNGTAEAVCTVCGEGKLEKELALNPDNHEEELYVDHLDATCVYDGYHHEYYPCCNKVVKEKEPITALGHGETAWEVVTEANCYLPGTQREYCTVCTATITEATAYGYTEDAEGEYAYVTVTVGEGEDAVEEKVTEEIDGTTYYKYYRLPATGEHVKYVTEKVESVPGTQGHVKYACKTDGCTWTDIKYLDKVEAFTVTFLGEDGKTEIAKITKDEGEFIAATEVTAPEKAATAESKYSFAGWVEVVTAEDGKVSDGATYKLPLEVTKNMTLKASYKETKKLYTHIFKVPTTWTETLAEGEDNRVLYATLVGTYGAERVPSGTPAFTHKDKEEDARLKKLYTFEFKGWKNADGVLVTDFTVAGDAEFTAVFEAKAIKYDVIFYNGDKAIYSNKVDAGEAAEYDNKDADGEIIVPEKEFDDTYHYTFSKWYTDADCTVEYKGADITEKTRLYAGYTAVAHDYDKDDDGKDDGTIKQEATCILPEITEFTCTCGHTKTVETAAVLGHDMYKKDENGDYVLDESGAKVENIVTETTEDGVFKVLKCSRCGEKISSEEVTVTVTFKHDNGAKDYVAKLDVNAEITYDVKPEKEATAEKTFTFEGWYLEGDEEKKLVTSFEVADQDKVFVAKYKEEIRKYVVSYMSADLKTPILSEEVEYGEEIPAAPAAPEKASTENDHYVFVGWSVEAGTIVTGEMEILPDFDPVKHDFKPTGNSTGATCTEPGGEEYLCEGCGMKKTSGGTQATGHKFREVIDQKAATYEEAGYIIKKCANCEETQTTVIPQRQYKYIKVTVKDAKGNPVEGAKVDLYREGTWIESNKSNIDGKVTFKVGDEDYKYTVLISGVDGLENKEFDVSAGGEIETNAGGTSNSSCSCSCHRSGFWGIVFRFFHKVISWFTGRIICCSCPDEAY